jgi:signal-transduction protein with cAMP-binding, CBS, and nucleotidyltransferase domain
MVGLMPMKACRARLYAGKRAGSLAARRTHLSAYSRQQQGALIVPQCVDEPRESQTERSMSTVAQLLSTKPDQPVFTIAASASVYDAIRMMADKFIGAVIVTEGDEIVGIVTERDYARKVVLMERSSKQTPVRDIMTSHVRYVRVDQTTDECMALMTEKRIRHLPVIDNGKLIGMISIGDLVKNIISEQQFTIKQLEYYIRGEST